MSRMLLMILVVLALAQCAYFYPRLPDVMASHFDGTGTPDGHQTKSAFFLLTGGIVVLTIGLFVLMGPLLRSVPEGWISMPNRDYWLAGERRDETIRYLSDQMEWFGVATMLLLLVVLQNVFEANLMESPVLDSTTMWWSLGLYFAYTLVWTVRLIARFRLRETPRAL